MLRAQRVTFQKGSIYMKWNKYIHVFSYIKSLKLVTCVIL